MVMFFRLGTHKSKACFGNAAQKYVDARQNFQLKVRRR